MRAKIESIDLIDHENWAYFPDDMSNFCVAAEALIGPEDDQGAEIFGFEVCTPIWFSENLGDGPLFLRHVILINEYNEQEIKRIVESLVERTFGNSWHEIAEKLSRYMRWEFEDYQPTNKQRI